MIPPITIATSLPSGAGSYPRQGQVFQAVIQGKPDALFVQLGGAKVPLAGAEGLLPGQPVRVEVLSAAPQLTLRIAVTASETPGAPLAAATAVLGQVLESLGANRAAEAAAQLAPPHLPQTGQALQQLFTLFLSRGSLGGDLEQLAQLLTRAAADGVIPQTLTTQFSALLAAMSASQSDGFRRLLEQMEAPRGLEARLALALQAGNIDEALATLDADLRAQLAQLKDHAALRQWLRGQGQLQSFDRAAAQVLDRVSGSQLQNLHNLAQPYVFVELPLPPNGGLRHAQIHFLSDAHGKGKRFDGKNATVALDLSTSQLGEIWITLRVVSGRCQCHVRAATEDAWQAFRGAASELAAALNSAGYPGSEVNVARWDGDRLRAAASLLRRFSGIDVNA